MVSFDEEKYLKNKPPPSPHGIKTLPITVRYSCVAFLIQLFANHFSLQFGDLGDPRNQGNPTNLTVEVQLKDVLARLST